ncbi:MAG: VWA domain-containing protein [Gammaproteobacteria bacterium]|nr:VWA domain-containing protein [Gammaproteobacteria bacterium]
MFTRALALFLVAFAAVAAPTVDGPATGAAGGEITVTVAGNPSPRDFVTIVPKGAREGQYGAYQYANAPGPLKLPVPSEPGDYEIRLLGADSPYPTLVRRPLRVAAVTATLDGPTQVAAGARFEVRWTGPNHARDYVGIGDADPKGRLYITYAYTNTGSPVSLVAPDKPGAYELRYYLGLDNKVIASRPLTVGSVTASVSAPATVAAGAKVSVTWSGPNNPRDFITIVKAGTADKQYGPYAYTSKGTPLELRAPDEPGAYEVRYLTGQTYATLGSTKLTVAANTASVQGPAQAVAGSTFPVNWKGPNNQHDYVTIVAPDAREGTSGNYAYTARGNPAQILAPLKEGDYELRYSTGQSHATLARAPIRITPAKVAAGFVSVSAAGGSSAGAVEIILDASGSMLQRIGSQRRIDLAKQTLTKLTSGTIAAGTPFALRVLGREVDSCQTDLEIPLAPLNAAAVAAKIAKLESKNNARTPLGASLDKVMEDLRAATGERLVILLTDGDETCGATRRGHRQADQGRRAGQHRGLRHR